MNKTLAVAVIAGTFFSFEASAQERAGSAALGAVSTSGKGDIARWLLEEFDDPRLRRHGSRPAARQERTLTMTFSDGAMRSS